MKIELNNNMQGNLCVHKKSTLPNDDKLKMFK